MPLAKINSIKLHYEIRGTGPRVLFIHGIGADLKHPMSIFNSPLPQYFTVLAFDPRGLGESDSPTVSCSIADLADDATGLAEAVGWDRYHVFGASMGGMVAQELALRHPSAVDRLVLGVTNGGGANSGPRVVDKLNEMSATEKLKMSDIRKDEAWATANPEMVSRTEEQSRAAREALHANPALLRGFNNQVNAVLKHDTFDHLHRIKAPTLVFGGRYDGSCPPDITRAMANQIPGTRYELLESGHADWFFDPTAWKMITDFLLIT
ncbi:alpha/beta fold hydrolase [Desulfoscipio gibsoniae]|uniref:Putative hydrolase or acyltransferase of alpha/beta superfamily n=1 Tax=Desulfoscipio gibsoniae DSM 7213 TaxID=767817 RepID=R4KLZ9_9FIRM|nr:alpha/beta fold hydrolase [Desulfoscipio gibsoniae]AGL02572.1 putative hydrolase or acyltransferase of alpha/beta superfamily [Desulfoscipio gibsoniae DSM 7213]